jgi:hypothetical protein
LKKNESLTSLNLGYNKIGVEGAKAIAQALEKNESLTSLYLMNNKIGAEGAKALAQALEKNESLTSLDFWNNKIGDEGAKAIAQALEKNESLTSLELWNNDISEELKSQIKTLIERNCKIRDEFLSQTKETIKTLNDKNNGESIAFLEQMREVPLAHQIYALSKTIEAALDLDKDNPENKDNLTNHFKMIKFFLGKNISIDPEILEKVKKSKNQTLSVLLQSFDKNSALLQQQLKAGELSTGQLEEKRSSILPRAEEFPRAAVGMLAKGSQVEQRRGTFDNILANLTRQELATLRANIAKLENLPALSKNTLQTNSLEVRKLLQKHATTLNEIATTHVSNKQARSAFEQAMQNPQAEAYYMSIISNLNGAYVATSCVKSDIIDHDKVGRLGTVGKVISAVSEIIPIGGFVTKVLGSVLSGVYAAKLKTRLNRLANLSGSVVDFDAIAKSVANELVKQKRHVNGGAAEKDIETMLKAIFKGKVKAGNNIAGELVEIVTGKAVTLHNQASAPVIAVSFVARHAPRPAATPSPDHTDAIAKILAEQKRLKADNELLKAEVRKLKKTNPQEKTVEGSAQAQAYAEAEPDQKTADNKDATLRRRVDALGNRIGGIEVETDANRENVAAEMDNLRYQLAEAKREANRKNQNSGCCVTM